MGETKGKRLLFGLVVCFDMQTTVINRTGQKNSDQDNILKKLETKQEHSEDFFSSFLSNCNCHIVSSENKCQCYFLF